MIMKIKIFTTLLLTLVLTGCQKEPDQSEISATVSRNQKTITQFNAADEKIGHFLDQLENTHTSIETKKRIICKDYPIVYHNEYVPTLLQRLCCIKIS